MNHIKWNIISLKKERNSDTHHNMHILEDTILSEISHSRKDGYCMISLIRDSWSSQVHRDGKWNGGRQGLGRGMNEKLVFNGYRASAGNMESSGERRR